MLGNWQPSTQHVSVYMLRGCIVHGIKIPTGMQNTTAALHDNMAASADWRICTHQRYAADMGLSLEGNCPVELPDLEIFIFSEMLI